MLLLAVCCIIAPLQPVSTAERTFLQHILTSSLTPEWRQRMGRFTTSHSRNSLINQQHGCRMSRCRSLGTQTFRTQRATWRQRIVCFFFCRRFDHSFLPLMELKIKNQRRKELGKVHHHHSHKFSTQPGSELLSLMINGEGKSRVNWKETAKEKSEISWSSKTHSSLYNEKIKSAATGFCATTARRA